MFRQSTSRLLIGVIGLWAEVVSGELMFDADCCEWQLSTPVYVSGAAYHFDDGNSSHDLQTLSLAAEIEWSSAGSPWKTGVFVDRRFSADDSADGIVNAGTYLQHYARRWDTSVWVFSHNPPDASSQWVFATRVRYLLAARHKVGLEVFGSFADAEKTDALLGYYGDLNERLSVKLVAGVNVNDSRNRIVRTELVFQIH